MENRAGGGGDLLAHGGRRTAPHGLSSLHVAAAAVAGAAVAGAAAAGAAVAVLLSPPPLLSLGWRWR